MDAQSSPRSAIPRRGPPLAPIRTDLPRPVHDSPVLQKPRPQRPRPNDAGHGSAERVPLQSPHPKRQSSKTNLRSLFTRKKSLRESKRENNNIAVAGERRESNATETPLSPTNTGVTMHSVVASPTVQSRSTGDQSKKTPAKKDKQKPLHPVTSTWSPPPLFQAYPQSIKHACLLTPALSADTILRIQAARRNSDAVEETQDSSSKIHPSSAASAAKKKKEERERRKHERKISGSISKTLWSKKIFVLVTSGYLLQYAGEGSFDRLPEKMLRLGPASAAFASDAIPGKPWVLQISQTSYEDGSVAMDSPRGLLSRFGFQSADSRRSTRSFFMVFMNPEEMNSWLVTLRKEIESLGGKKYVPESASDDDDDKAPQVYSRPLMVANDLRSRKSSPGPVQTPNRRSPAPSIQRKYSHQEMTNSMNSQLTKAMNRRSMPSSDSLSVSTATTQRDADTIHDYTTHLSGSTPTVSSSQGPSPALSPVQPQPRPRRRTTAATSSQNRRSMYSYAETQSDRQVKDVEVSTRPRSLIGDASYLQSPSPLPNFSLPSFSKRFGLSRGSSRSQDQMSAMGDEPVSPTSLPKESQSVATGPGVQRVPVGSRTETAEDANVSKRRSFVYDSSFIRDPTPSPLQSPPSPLSGPRSGSSNPSLASSERYYSRVRSPGLSLPLQTNAPQDDAEQRNGIYPQSSHANSKLPKPSDSSSSSRVANPPVRFPFTTQTNATAVRRGSQPESAQQLPSSFNAAVYGGSKPSKAFPTNSTQIGASPIRQQKASAPGATGQLSPRKSMPNLSRPPVGPPPDCPLPEVPPDIASQHRSAWHKIPTVS